MKPEDARFSADEVKYGPEAAARIQELEEQVRFYAELVEQSSVAASQLQANVLIAIKSLMEAINV